MHVQKFKRSSLLRGRLNSYLLFRSVMEVGKKEFFSSAGHITLKN